MRIFLAGASGVLGQSLLPILLADGHVVAAMTRTAAKAQGLRVCGAEAVVCDVFDADALTSAVTGFAPDLVMHQLTDLPDDPRRIAEASPRNSRIRREGTANLLAAARAAKAARFLAQSVAWTLPGDGGEAVRDLEQMVLSAPGVVIRYGQFYGPGTYHAERPDAPAIEVTEAARRTARLLDARPGIITVAEGA